MKYQQLMKIIGMDHSISNSQDLLIITCISYNTAFNFGLWCISFLKIVFGLHQEPKELQKCMGFRMI